MYRLGQCTLVYIHQSQDENYNPVIEKISKTVKCQLMDAFSLNYYQNQTRDMRRARNLVIAKHNSFDQVVNDKVYKLEYAEIGRFKYKVTNILKDRNSDLNVVLDCEEVMNE